jgi:hypothetical protein
MCPENTDPLAQLAARPGPARRPGASATSGPGADPDPLMPIRVMPEIRGCSEARRIRLD